MNETTVVTVNKGADSYEATIARNATVRELLDDPIVAVMLDLGDNVTIVRNGVELPDDAELEDGDDVQAVEAGNEKG